MRACDGGRGRRKEPSRKAVSINTSKRVCVEHQRHDYNGPVVRILMRDSFMNKLLMALVQTLVNGHYDATHLLKH